MTNAVPAAAAALDRLQERVELPEYGLAVGVLFVPGAGHRIGAFGPRGLSDMSPAQARRFARDLADSDEADELRPVIDALEALAERLDALRTAVPAGRA